jgi:integrase
MREISNVKELKKYLIDVIPVDEQFKQAFETATVSKGALARYYLRSLEMAAKKEANPWFIPNDDMHVINLEHVLLGHANIQMTMRYAHLAPAHKADAMKKLSAFNAAERKRQDAVILFPAGQGKATDTTTDTEAKSALAVAAGNR